MALPAPDEFEISLFGPGYGESVVAHLGAGQWIVVDSCVDSATKEIAPLAYLDSLGLDPASAVRLVVASHWHDDHIRGLSTVVRRCANARFVSAVALNRREFTSMVVKYEARNKIAAGTGVGEMFEILQLLNETERHVEFACPNRPVLRCREAETLAGGECVVTTLSPSDKQIELFFAEIAGMTPAARETKRRAVSRSPNHVAVAIWIAAGNDSLLLGSDLEETKDPLTGWSVIVASKERPVGAASVIKVAHHGSPTGHSDDVWDSMVAKGAYAILTPFVRGSVSLPGDEDVKRIVDSSENAYSTSRSEVRASPRRDPAVERMIRETVGRIRTAEPKSGHVRLRKKFGNSDPWSVELFGNAGRLTTPA